MSSTQADLDAVNAEIAEQELALAALNERQEKIDALNKESTANEQRIAATTEYLKEAEAALADFPTDAQMTKWRGHLDALKIELDKAEAAIQAANVGLQAYAQRGDHASTSMLDMAASLLAAIHDIEADVVASVQTEATLKETDTIRNACGALAEIDTAQEEALQAALKESDSLATELAAQRVEIQRLQDVAQSQLPDIHRERDTTLAEITTAWQEEREALQAVYQRLLTVGREQHHHLTRGTHIKQAPKLFTKVQVDTLSSQNARLSAEAIAASARNNDLKEDATLVRKRCDTLREEGRRRQQAYDEAKAARQVALTEAEAKLAEVTAECNELRDVRAELTQALHEMRDAKAIMLASCAARAS